MKSKIIKFLVIGLWIPSTISTSRADIVEHRIVQTIQSVGTIAVNTLSSGVGYRF